VRPKVSFSPRYAAVKVTGVAFDTLPAPTVNVVELEPAAMVTVDGRIASLGFALSAIVAPELSAADARFTVHAILVGGVIDTALQLNPFKPGPSIVITPLLAATGIEAAFESAAIPFANVTVEELSGVVLASLYATVATTPFAIPVVSMP